MKHLRRGQSAGRAGTRGPYQSGHDATLHRGRYGGQAEARRAAVSRVRYGVPCVAAHSSPGPHHTRLCWRWVRALRCRPSRRAARLAPTPAATRAGGKGTSPESPPGVLGSAYAAGDRSTHLHVLVPCSLPGPSSPGAPSLCSPPSVRLLHACDCATDMCTRQGLDFTG